MKDIEEYKAQVLNHPHFNVLLEFMAKERMASDDQLYKCNVQIVHEHVQRFRKKHEVVDFLCKGIGISPSSITKWEVDLRNIQEVNAYILHNRSKYYYQFKDYIEKVALTLLQNTKPIIKTDVAA